MSASVSSKSDLFFDSLVRGYVGGNRRFVRRGWLAKELDAKLNEPGTRFVLLTAEPGAGKSAFLAQLAHDHPEWLRYFIRRDQREVLADVSDKSLLLRIGYQLAARHPELFTEGEVRLSVSVEQHLGQLVDVLASKAGRNFLVARCALDAIARTTGTISLAAIERLPSTLSEYYLAYLAAEYGSDEGTWRDRIAPVAGLLSVAREPLSEAQLAAIASLTASDVRSALTRLRSFLISETAAGATVWRLYHQAFAEFLSSAEKAEEFWLPAIEQHRKFATSALDGGSRTPAYVGRPRTHLHLVCRSNSD